MLNSFREAIANTCYGHRIYYRGQAYGIQEDYGFWFDLKPWDRLLLENSFSWSRSEDEFTGEAFFDSYVMRSKLGIQINPFSIFNLDSTRDYVNVTEDSANQQDWRLTHRQYFLKLQFLFRI